MDPRPGGEWITRVFTAVGKTRCGAGASMALQEKRRGKTSAQRSTGLIKSATFFRVSSIKSAYPAMEPND